MKAIRVIGGGLAGSILALQSHWKGYSVEWWRFGQPSSSLVASGIYNPVVLKRLRLVWKAREFALSAEQFYQQAATSMKVDPRSSCSLYHKIVDAGFANDWQMRSENEAYQLFLGPIEKWDKLSYGLVHHAHQLNTAVWLQEVAQLLEAAGHRLMSQEWHPSVEKKEDVVTVLCQGWKRDQLPYGIPAAAFAPVKGEVLKVELPGYPFPDKIIHGAIFILPIGNDTYKIGATYSWDELDEEPTEQGREWLLQQLGKLWKGEARIIDQYAAVRPAVKDRKPIVGAIPQHDNLYVLNGLGSRGTLMAPLLSTWLLHHLETETPLPDEVNVQRFF